MAVIAEDIHRWKPRELLAHSVVAAVLGRHAPDGCHAGPAGGDLEAWHVEVREVTEPATPASEREATRRRLEAVLRHISRSPTGRDLVEVAHREDIDICVDGSLGRDGYFAREHRVAVVDLHRLSDAQASLSMTRTLSHVRQAAAGVAVDFRRYSAAGNALINRSLHADAVAETCQVAWELKQSGAPEVWQEARRHPTYLSAVASFAGAVASNAEAATDGRARRAAYDGWFKLAGVVQEADAAMVRMHEGLSSMAPAVDADAATLAPLGPRPDGTNQFAVAGAPQADDPVYQQFRPEIAERLARLTPAPVPTVARAAAPAARSRTLWPAAVRDHASQASQASIELAHERPRQV